MYNFEACHNCCLVISASLYMFAPIMGDVSGKLVQVLKTNSIL